MLGRVLQESYGLDGLMLVGTRLARPLIPTIILKLLGRLRMIDFLLKHLCDPPGIVPVRMEGPSRVMGRVHDIASPQ